MDKKPTQTKKASAQLSHDDTQWLKAFEAESKTDPVKAEQMADLSYSRLKRPLEKARSPKSRKPAES